MIKIPATTVIKVDKILGSTSKVPITKMAKESKMISMMGGRPSRYIAKINALYTKANPSSCCITDKIAGTSIMTPAIKWDLNFEKSVSGFAINFAKIKAVNILQSSAGCKLNPPAIGIQLLDPLISFPKKRWPTLIKYHLHKIYSQVQ